MGVRQTLNEKAGLGIGIGAATVVIAIALLALQLNGGSEAEAPTSAFFTDDNGKTFFKGDIEQFSPFDRNGKKAYRADVFRCAEGHEFVGLIFRHTEGGRKEMQDYLSNMKSRDVDGQLRVNLEQRGMEVKRAGGNDKSWAPNDELYTDRLRSSVKCPQGKPGELVTP